MLRCCEVDMNYLECVVFSAFFWQESDGRVGYPYL